MQLKVTGRDISLTPALKDYTEKRLERVQRHIPRIIGVDVILRRERQDHVVDIRLNAGKLKMKVSGRSPDMYASIDDAISRLERASRKQKERKIQTPRVRAIRARRDRAREEDLTIAEREEASEIAKVTKLSVKPMSTDEALLQIKALDFSFLLFEDSDDNHVKVIYRRNDNTFGLIEPDME